MWEKFKRAGSRNPEARQEQVPGIDGQKSEEGMTPKYYKDIEMKVSHAITESRLGASVPDPGIAAEVEKEVAAKVHTLQANPTLRSLEEFEAWALEKVRDHDLRYKMLIKAVILDYRDEFERSRKDRH